MSAASPVSVPGCFRITFWLLAFRGSFLAHYFFHMAQSGASFSVPILVFPPFQQSEKKPEKIVKTICGQNDSAYI